MTSLRTLLITLVCIGCTTTGETVDAGSAAMEARSGSLGIVQIERAAAGDPDVAAPRAVLGAAFARYRGVHGRTVIGLLGGRALATGTCRIGNGDDDLDALEAEVELVDVGGLEVTVAGTRTRMTPRTFPDLAGFVSGAFYAEDATLGAARAEVDEYVLTSEGSEAVPPFEVVVVAPPGFAEVLVDGADASQGRTVFRGADLELGWDAGDPQDRVEVDVLAGSQVLQCAGRDDGSFRIPADLLAALDPDLEARLVLRRVRTQPFDAGGIDDAWINLATTRTVALPVR